MTGSQNAYIFPMPLEQENTEEKKKTVENFNRISIVKRIDEIRA